MTYERHEVMIALNMRIDRLFTQIHHFGQPYRTQNPAGGELAPP